MCENPRLAESALSNYATFKVTYISFLPFSDARFGLQEVFFTLTRCTELLPRAGSFPVCLNNQLNKFTRKSGQSVCF